MDGRKLTVERNLPVDTLWIIRDEGAWCAAVEREADAHLFVQADALKRDNARMAGALKRLASWEAIDGNPNKVPARDNEYRLRADLAGACLASLEVREDG